MSIPRLERYLKACSHNEEKCIKLYKSNLKVAQAFHPILGFFEVVIRNRINHQLTIHFGDPDWIINQKSGFMVDPILTYTNKKTGRQETNRFILKSVILAENKLKKRAQRITSGRIISEQTFGFWTEFFENHHYKILKGRPIKVFERLPVGYGRSEILNQLSVVRHFRNRINHNEPTCFVGESIDFSYTKTVYHSIAQLLQWVDPELIGWLRDIDQVEATIEEAICVGK